METRIRTITIPNSEKLAGMSRGEVDKLMHDLGKMGLEPVLKEKNIPPELLPLTDEAREKLSTPLNFREYEGTANSLDVSVGEHTPKRLWDTLRRADTGIVKKAEDPFYEIDMRQFLEDYAAADTQVKKTTVMDRHSWELIHSYEYIEPLTLIEAIESGDLYDVDNVGEKMIGLSVEIANQLIRNASQDSSVD